MSARLLIVPVPSFLAMRRGDLLVSSEEAWLYQPPGAVEHEAGVAQDPWSEML